MKTMITTIVLVLAICVLGLAVALAGPVPQGIQQHFPNGGTAYPATVVGNGQPTLGGIRLGEPPFTVVWWAQPGGIYAGPGDRVLEYEGPFEDYGTYWTYTIKDVRGNVIESGTAN